MTDRTGPPAHAVVCPFVAYGDDRDNRASVPEHRHRCFAETPAAPRALAHQAAYCLSASFAGCPTFADWARRESAPVKDTVPLRPTRDTAAPRLGERLEAGPISRLAPAVAPPDVDDGLEVARQVNASPPRHGWPEVFATEPAGGDEDWAAPPPWAGARTLDPDDGEPADDGADEEGGAAAPGGPPAGVRAPAQAAASVAWGAPDPDADGGAHAREAPVAVPSFLAGRGRPSGTRIVVEGDDHDRHLADDDDDLAGGMASATPRRAPVGYAPAGRGRREDGRRAGASTRDPVAPSWERPRTFQDFPSLRTRSRLPSLRRVPPLGAAVGILALAAVAVFLLPILLRGGGGSSGPSPSPSAGASIAASVSPAVRPSATPHLYTVVANDTLIKIANKFNVTVAQILAANKSIKDQNSIRIGDKIVIPGLTGGGGGTTITQPPSPSPSPSPSG